MSGALNATTMSKLLEELRRQNWTLNASPDGLRWRAEPPDPKRKTILFSARATELTPVLRQLAEQGFRWPPATTETTPPAVVRAAPFPPKSHPDVEIERKPPAAPTRPLALVRPAQDLGPDEAFRLLKETREYRVLASQDLEDARAVFATAETALKGATAVYDDACKQERAAKAAFDGLFEGGKP